MKNRLITKTPQAAMVLLAALLFFATSPAQAQLDESCKVMINNQTVQVGFGGEFRIRNIPAGNNLLRIHAICTKGGKTRYGRSVFYQVQNRQTITLSELDFVWRDTPFPTTASIIAVPDKPTLTDSAGTTQIRVTATLSDSSKLDVTSRGFGSTYTSSNPNIATVDQNGLIKGIAPGTVSITVNNEGATAVTRIAVSPGDPLTTVEGFVQLDDRTPVTGAEVRVTNAAGMAITRADGSFSIPGVPTLLGPIIVTAFARVNNMPRIGISSRLTPVPKGFTDAGIITLIDAVFWIATTSGFWDVGANWSTGAVPGPNDNVLIVVPEGIRVTHRSGTNTVKSLRCESDLVISGGTLSIASSALFADTLTISGGTFANNGESSLLNATIWTGGTIAGTGVLTNIGRLNWTGGNTSGPIVINNTGVFNITGSSVKDFTSGTINNSGTVTWTGTGQLRGGGSSQVEIFNNLAGATFNIRANSFWNGDVFGAPPTIFTNAGTIIKSDSSGTATLEVTFNNTGGTLDVQSGTLALSLGGNSTSGVFTAANGTNLNFSGGTHSFSGTYSGSGAGFIQLTGGTIQINTGATFNITGSGFRLNGGTLNGTGVFTNFGRFDWTGGTISGQVTISNRGAFNISGSSVKDFTGGTINNAGMITLTGTGQLRGGGSSQVEVFNNLAGATFSIRDNSFWNGDVFGAPPTIFNNAGTVIKSDSSGTATLDVTFNNTGGIVEVQSGVLTMSQRSNYRGGTLNVAAGATLNLSGTHVFSGSQSGLIDGLIQFGTLQIDTVGTTFNFTGKGFTWTGGTIVGPGTLTNTGLFSISGSSVKDFTSGTINNSGTVTWTGTGQLRGGGSGQVEVFNNLAGATFNIRDNSFWNGDVFGAPSTIFNNSGTVIKSDSSGTATLDVTFNNTGGTINVQSGTLALSLGGNSTGGTFTTANGANLNFSGGTHSFSGAYSGSGAGFIQLTGGTIQINTGATFNITGSGFRLNGGTMTGPGTLTNSGTFDLTSGSISGQAIIANTGAFNISGSSLKDFIGGATINNTGTVTWTGAGQIRGGTGSVFNNLANGTFDIQVDASFSGGAFGGTPTAFNNAGTVKKSAGTGTNTLALPFNNTGGAIEVQSGTLALSTGGASTGGRITVATGTSLNLSGTHIFSGSYSGSVDGSVSLVTLQIAANGTTFNFTGGGFKWANGNIIGPGTLTNIGLFSISGSSLKDFTSGAIINNSGMVIWNGTGTIRGGTGSVFNNLAGGTFDIQVDATFSGGAFGGTPTAINNAGTFRKSAGAGTTTLSVTLFNNSGTVAIDTGIVSLSNGFTQQTSSSNVSITISGINAGTGFGQHRTTGGTTTLAGNLNVSLNNFTPSAGDNFQVMTFVNRNNTQFAKINLPALPPGRIWGPPVYTNTSLTLSVVAGQ